MESLVTMQNEKAPGAVFDDWCVRIGGVDVLRTPVFGRAMNTWVACRNNHNELDTVVHVAVDEICDDIKRGLRMNDPCETQALIEQLAQLVDAGKKERDRILSGIEINIT